MSTCIPFQFFSVQNIVQTGVNDLIRKYFTSTNRSDATYHDLQSKEIVRTSDPTVVSLPVDGGSLVIIR